jgi:hypothetical protein
MKIAVIGAGIFGCTAAIHLARKNHDVTLIDKSDSILRGATTANQLRLHRGFHYPRSPETIKSCRDAADLFREEYGLAVDYGGRQFYAIGRHGSKTNPMQYMAVCEKHKLPVKNANTPPFALNYDLIDAVYEVSEAHINLPILRNMIWEKLKVWGVKCCFGCRVESIEDTFDSYERVVIACYAQNNEITRETQPYHYELIEKPVFDLPCHGFSGNSLVVMDGPFFSIDPLVAGSPTYHLVGHVKHCIHDEIDGEHSGDLEGTFAGVFLDKGLIPADQLEFYTAVPDFVEDIRPYVPGFERGTHIGSYFTIRAVPTGVDETDERPTEVKEVNERVIRIFSGKIGNCVDAAESVVEICSQ